MKYFKIFLSIILLFNSFLFVKPNETSAASTIKVTATFKVRPGYYWCQHSDGHWSTYSDIDGKVTSPNDGGEPKKLSWKVTTTANISIPKGKVWISKEGTIYDTSEVKEIKPISVKMQPGADPALQGEPYIQNNKVIIKGYSGKGVYGFEDRNICGGNKGMIYPFPVEVTFEGEVNIPAPPTCTIEITPKTTSLVIGETTNLTAILTWSDQPGKEYDITSRANWSSSNSSSIPIDHTGKILGKKVDSPVTLTASFSNRGATCSATAIAQVKETPSELIRVEVRPPKHIMGVGETRWFRAFAIYNDNTEKDVTEDSNWSIADSSIATIEGLSKGGVKGKKVGITQITATYTGKSASGTVEVVNTPPEPPEPEPQPPTPENIPPTVNLTAPLTVTVGEKFCIQSNAYDEDGYIVEYRWTIPGLNLNGLFESEIETMETLCDVYYEEEGEKRVFIDVTDNDGSFAIDETYITVLPPMPKADFKVSGYLKENRKVIIENTSKEQEIAPIDWGKSYWEITAIDPANQEAIKHVQPLNGSKNIDALFKKQGEYKIKLHVENTKGYTDETERIITIAEDKKPKADFSTPLVIYRDPENSNKATIKITDLSYSTDDKIAEMYYTITYDSNNNGDFSDETPIQINGQPGVEAVYEATKVGKYQIEQFVKESFGQPTIEQFVTQEDYLTDDTLDKSLSTKIVDVMNLPPSVGLEAKIQKEIDIDLFVGETSHNKTDLDVAAKTVLLPRLAQEGIKASINLKEGLLRRPIPNGKWIIGKDAPVSSRFYRNQSILLRTHLLTLPNGKVFILNTNTPYIYDPITDTWTTGAKLPSLTHNAVAPLSVLLPDGRVVVLNYNKDRTFIYSPETDTWTEGAKRPLGDKIYDNLVYGIAMPDGSVLALASNVYDENKLLLYNTTTDTWEYKGSLQHENSLFYGISMYNGKMLLTGGFFWSGATPTIRDTAEVTFYDPVTKESTKGINLPIPFYHHKQSTLNDGRVILTGGDNSRSRIESYSSKVHFYNPITSELTRGPDMPYSSNQGSHSQTILHDGRLMVLNDYKTYFLTFEQPLTIKFEETGKDKFVGILDDKVFVPSQQNELFSSLRPANAHLIGLGTSENKNSFEQAITTNDNKGIFINNSDLDKAMYDLAEYIIKELRKNEQSKDIYITLDESIEYNTFYSDFEQDPMFEDRWRFTHDETVFENSMGISSYHDKYLTQPVTKFDKVGMYIPGYSARDNPVGTDDRFDNYRMWSNETDDVRIFVHRKPVADFTYSINLATKEYTIINTSYDLDKYSKNIGYGPGIQTIKWEWREKDTIGWNNGLPPNPLTKTYEVKLTVTDFQSASNFIIKEISNLNNPPYADFEIPSVITLNEIVTPNNLSFDPDGDPITYEWWIKPKNEPDSAYVLFSNEAEPSRVMDQLGTFTFRLRVKDDKGLYSNYAIKDVNVIFPVILEPLVTHTEGWKKRWVEAGYDEDINIFYAGEKFIIRLKTSPAASVSGFVDFGGTVGIVNIPSSAFTVTKSEKEYLWEAELWRADFVNIPKGIKWFSFTAQYPDIATPSKTKTELYPIEIVDTIYNTLKFHQSY